MSTQRDHVDPLLEEIPVTSSGEEVDPKVLDLAMKIAEKMFLKMKEEDAKKKAEEEESRRKAEEDKGKGKFDYNDDLVDLLVSKVLSKVSLNTEGSSTKSKGNEFSKVQFDYSRNFIPNFSSAPLGKLPTLSELNYDEWADKMKSHLIGVHPSLWEIVNVGMYKPAQGEEMTPEMMQEVHRNAQAVSIIKGSLCPEEYRKVQGREDARDIWNILKMSHEGDPKAKRHRVEALESELARYDWIKGESLQSLFDRLMVLVNKIRVLGSEDWSDSKVTRLFMRAYKEKDKSLARMIRDRDDYEDMTPHQLFAKIQQHESEEAPIKTRDSHALITNEQDNPKKNKDHKAKKVVETSSDEDSSSDEDTAMFIKTFKKFVRKNDKFQRKGKKRACYECGQTGHFIADCPNKKEQEAKKEYKKDKFKKGGKTKGYFKKKKYGQAHIGEEWNSDEESSSSEEEEVVANVAIQSTSSSQLFTNLQDDSYTPTCLMAKGDKVTLFSNDFPNDDDDEQIAMKNKMIKEFGLNGYNVITKLMEKLDKRKATLDAQEDLLILEKERNLELQELLHNKDEMLDVLTKEVSLVKITIENKDKEVINMKTSIANLANEKNALESSMLSLNVQNQELQVQLENCKNINASSLVIESKSSSLNDNFCKHCAKYHASCCLTNHARKNSPQVKVKEILKRCSSNDGLKKVEPKYKSLKPNNGRRGLGFNSSKENPSTVHKGWRSPKFIEGTTLYDALGRIHSSNDKSTQVKVNLSSTKSKMKEVGSSSGQQFNAPISHSYLCDYMLTWDLGKLVVKYVGAYTKRKVMKRSVWVPKAITNTVGPNSIWVPKSIA